MKRREFVTLLGGAAAWPLAARAQQPGQTRRIGVLLGFSESDPEAQTWMTALQDGLQKLGWVRNRNLHIDYRWSGSNVNRLRALAKELVNLQPDLIVAGATQAAVALLQEARSTPILFVQISDPVKIGLVASLAHPGGNITGFSNFEHAIGGKWLELLKDTAPGTTRVAVIFDPDNPTQAPYLQAIDAAAPLFGMQLTRADVRNAPEIERAINAFAHAPNGALIVVPNLVTTRHRDLIIALATRHRLPAVYPYRFFTSSGGLVSYGVDLGDLYRRAASYVDLILKGTKAGDLPVQLPTKFELVINLKAAKALGLTIPEPFLQTADEVIE